MILLKPSQALSLLRIAIATVFFLHAIVRLFNGSMDQFGSFLNGKGFLCETAMVWVITVFELIGGILLALGKFTKLIGFAFIGLLVMGIILIHFSQGWFVGEHGTGGMEYSFILIMGLLAVMSGNTSTTQKPGP